MDCPPPAPPAFPSCPACLRSHVACVPGKALRVVLTTLLTVLLTTLLTVLLGLPALQAAGAPAPVTVLSIDGAIGPASADYLVRGMAGAARGGSGLVVIELDTPGGLDTAMRAVIKAILASPVPVAAYVAPGGARAASAGTYIVYASHIAAMAPGTNLGAATPVPIGVRDPAGPVEPPGPAKPAQPAKPDKPDEPAKPANPANPVNLANPANPAKPATPAAPAGAAAPGSPSAAKQVNDAAAYLRALAQLRGRNADWAERAVREAVSLPAGEALKLNVIDTVAADLPALLVQLQGRRIALAGRELTLDTRGAALVRVVPDWRARLLGVISDPSIALILISIGVYGLLFEFMSPGAVVPGVVGAMCLLLGLYGLQLLPVNYAGLALVLLGMGFMVAEAFLPSFGVLGLGGIAAFVTGALILVDTELPGFGIPVALVVPLALASALLMAATAAVALATRRRPARANPGALVGSVAEVLEGAGPGCEGWANVNGETWRVVGKGPLQRAQQVRVTARRGAVLDVEPLAPEGRAPGP